MGTRIADVGCGVGNFASFLADRELYVAVDPDRDLTSELQKLHPSQGNIVPCNLDITADDAASVLRSYKIDTILCVNLLEHLRDDFKAVRNMKAALPIGGTLCVLVPACPWLYGTLDSLDGHVRRYTKKTLSTLLGREDMHLITVRYFNMIGIPGWFLKGRVLKQRAHADSNFTWMNRLVPPMSAIERMVRPPLGMSLTAVARKR